MHYCGIEFFTATCLNWQLLLQSDLRKEIITNSLRFLVEDKRIYLYGFVIMPNHIHVLWSIRDEWLDRDVAQMFLKYTAQQIKFNMRDSGNTIELEQYRSTQRDRQYQFWERRPWKAVMPNRDIVAQKLNYIHQNPVRKKLVEKAEEYQYSSAAFYEQLPNPWDFITPYFLHV